MALVQPTRILNQGGLFVLDGLPAIPEIGELFPSTRRWHAEKLKPCPSSAAWRRHQRRGEPICEACRAWRAVWDATRDRSTRDARESRPDPLAADAPGRLEVGLVINRDHVIKPGRQGTSPNRVTPVVAGSELAISTPESRGRPYAKPPPL